MGKFNSSKTRVEPVMEALRRVGSSWLAQLSPWGQNLIRQSRTPMVTREGDL